MRHAGPFFDSADHRSAGHFVAHTDRRLEIPAPRRIERRGRESRREEVATLDSQVLQWASDAIEQRADQARSELRRERLPRQVNRLTDGEARGILVDLQRHRVRVELDDLAEHSAVAHQRQLVQER